MRNIGEPARNARASALAFVRCAGIARRRLKLGLHVCLAARVVVYGVAKLVEVERLRRVVARIVKAATDLEKSTSDVAQCEPIRCT